MAELGNNPSFVWRSLLLARDVIKEGTRWKVGDGRSIGVFTHSWLSHTLVTWIEVPIDMKVCELIDQDTRQWDRGKVAATFTAQTRDEILSLPLNNTNGHDFVIWMENRAKKFMVKSSYKVAYRLRHHHKAEHSAARIHGSTWNMIWMLNVPPKVRTFIWRAYSNCLPTWDNLHRCRVSINRNYEMCKQELETTSHVL